MLGTCVFSGTGTGRRACASSMIRFLRTSKGGSSPSFCALPPPPGAGVLTRELVAALPAAEVTATDFNTAMAAYGKRQVRGALWQQADAQHLPFDDNQFDLLACQFGVMFFPDKPGAFREARRVLRR